MTKPARRSFRIIARYEGFGVVSGFVLPVRARDWPVILGVSPLPRNIGLGAVAAFARAPQTCGDSSEFVQGAPAAEMVTDVSHTGTFRSRFAPPYRDFSYIKALQCDTISIYSIIAYYNIVIFLFT